MSNQPAAPDDDVPRRPVEPHFRAIQYCPWCGEHIGSFWGRRDADGDHWCEACQSFFHVEER